MAIKERLIGANALRQTIESKIYWGGCDLLEAIDEAPTVDAAPVVHAHWDEWWPGDCALIMTGEEMLYQCSACTAKYSNVEGFRYCPHCGAFMDGGNADGKE